MKGSDLSHFDAEHNDIDQYKRNWSFIVFEFIQTNSCKQCDDKDIIEWIEK